MNEIIKYTISMIALGAALVAYAHSTFTTKELTNLIYEDVKYIKENMVMKSDLR